jgi:hypothetical protein|nr:MAG TPA: holin [Siphoviridae sp. cttiG1]
MPAFILNDKAYQITKWTVMIVMPALITFWITLANVWHIPHGDAVSATATAITTFLGVITGISTRAYNKSDDRFDGVMTVEEKDGKLVNTLELNNHPVTLMDKDEATFKVDNQVV